MERFLSFLVIFTGLVVSSGGALNATPDERTVIFPEARGAELVKAVCHKRPKGITGYWTPTKADLKGVEETLEEFVGPAIRGEKRDLTEYRRQVVGVMRGEKRFLFFNYAYSYAEAEREAAALIKARGGGEYDLDYWRKRPEVVDDGGRRFFRVLYDSDAKKFVWKEFNGY